MRACVCECSANVYRPLCVLYASVYIYMRILHTVVYVYVLVYTCKKKGSKGDTHLTTRARRSHVASVILSVYYAERWAGNNSFSRVLRSAIRSIARRSARFRAKGVDTRPRALRENARRARSGTQGRICTENPRSFRSPNCQNDPRDRSRRRRRGKKLSPRMLNCI